MAHEQHLKLINEAIERHDVAIWNKWREENPQIRPDLSGTDFSYSDLSGADFSGANLILTHLSATNLTGASFSGANLSDANFTEANLSEANFSDAWLVGALLLGADLNKANLENNVKDLMPSQVKTARHWENAYFSKHVLENLGLPPDHNEKLRKGD